MSEVFYRTLHHKPSSRNYYRQALLVFSEGDNSISLSRRHKNITTEFIVDKFDVLQNSTEPTVGWLITVYRNWLSDKSRPSHQENKMIETLTTELNIPKPRLCRETIMTIHRLILNKIESEDPRTSVIAQTFLDYFGLLTLEEASKILNVSVRRVSQLRAAMTSQIRLEALQGGV
jgi:hypothetical protein